MDAEILPLAAPAPSPPAAGAWRFGGRFALDLSRGILRSGNEPIALRPKTFALLQYLAAHPGRLISKDELLDRVWAGLVVTDDSVVQCIGELRAALDDRDQRLIVTVPRRGYRFDAVVEPAADADTGAPAPSGRARPRRWAWGLAAGAAVLLGLGAAFFIGRPFAPASSPDVDARVGAHRSIAVLPFTDLSEPAAPALAEAVGHDVTAELSRMPDMLVFASDAASRLPDAARQARATGRTLGATHVVTGSVQRLPSGEVVVRSRLMRVEDDTVLWSERLDYGNASWNWSQEIGSRIALALDQRLSDQHRPPASDYAGHPPDAVEATLQGSYLLRRMRTRDDLLQARALFEQALKLDPQATSALTRWALTHVNEVNMRWSTERERQVALAAEALERVLRQRPDYALAHFGMSQVMFLRGQVDEAARACERTLALWPNEPLCLRRLGFYRLQQGRPAELVPLVELAMRLDPLDPMRMSYLHFFLGMAAFHQHDDAAAYASMQRAVEANPHNGFGWQWLAAIDALHGHDEAAGRHLAEFRKLIPGQTIASLRSTEKSTSPAFWAQEDRFYEGLRKAGLPP